MSRTDSGPWGWGDRSGRGGGGGGAEPRRASMCVLGVAVGVAATLLFASYQSRHNGFARQPGRGEP